MAARQELHRLVDTLPDEQLQDLREYLADLHQSAEEALSPATEAAVQEGLEDIRRGRVIPLEEYRRTRRL